MKSAAQSTPDKSATAQDQDQQLSNRDNQRRRLSENMSDIGSERCPFEVGASDERKLTDAVRTSWPRKSLLQNLQEDQQQIARASKGSFSQPDFVEPGP